MKRSLVAAAVSAAGLLTLSAGPASAAHAYDPNVARVANPANVCTSIPGSVQYAAAVLGVTIDTSSFDYVGCVKTLVRGSAFVTPAPPFGDPYAQCDVLVTRGLMTYPDTLHNGPTLEDLLPPDLTVKNRKECGSALYAFHLIYDYVALYLPPES